ncbi:MAG TPA: plastocyanin/azurin family copper-binding protein [Methylomirabilota bacterium]|jgi:plastocyanin
MVTRRAFLTGSAVAFLGAAAPRPLRAAPPLEIRMRATERGEQVWFDPIGVLVTPGQTIRWVVERDVHTTTAYHPANDHHSRRIPEAAAPWDSGFLVQKGAHFDVTLTVDGVYDYYCLPHEEAGMVGRIIVGKPGGPGAWPFDYWKGAAFASGWKPVPMAAQQALPAIETIMKRKVVRRAPPA